MATTTFTAGALIFTNIWLIAIVSFAIIALSIFLYVLGAVDIVVRSSLTISLTCSAISFIYLTLQCINVNHMKNRRWRRTWLSSICAQFPRILIVVWIIATTIGVVVALRKPLCTNGNIEKDAAAWQAGIGCWVFRVLVSLDGVMLALSFTLFCLLEVNGRHISLALFHFEYAPSSTSRNPRRRTLMASPYGRSVETFSSPITITSEDELQLMHEKRDSHPFRTMSPSPTYHTFDSARTYTSTWPRSVSTSGNLLHSDSRDTFLCDAPIPIDLTLHDSLSSHRRSPGPITSRPTSNKPNPNANTNTIYSSAQLRSRPLSDIPDIPPKTRTNFHDLKSITGPLVTAPAAARILSDHKPITHSAPHNVAERTITQSTRFKSTCALPFESATRAHSMVDLASYCKDTATSITLNTHSSVDLAIPKSTTATSLTSTIITNHDPNPTQTQTQAQPPNPPRLSTSSLPDHPLPSWCPHPFKSLPLSADPTIRRLTELHSRTRSRTSTIRSRTSRLGTRVSRKGSLGAFEFGFGAGGVGRGGGGGRRSVTLPGYGVNEKESARMSTCDEHGVGVDEHEDEDMDLDLSHLPATPTPLVRKGRRSGIRGKENRANHRVSTSILTSTSTPTITVTGTKPEELINRGRERNGTMSPVSMKRASASRSGATSKVTSTSTSVLKGQFSLMPPIIGTGRRGTGSVSNSGSDSTSGSGTGLGIGGVNVLGGNTSAVGSGNKSAVGGIVLQMDRCGGGETESNRKIVERGRYERLPR